ncbi:MAG: histidinol dehydrogenase [Spirochaetaceae bacterium]
MDIRLYEWNELSPEERATLLRRAEHDIESVRAAVGEIMDRVRSGGDEALREYTRRFDGADTAGLPIAVTARELDEAERALTDEVRRALEFSIDNVYRVHEAQPVRGLHTTEVRPGVWAGERATAVPSAGLYVPHGRGSFPSMLYMLAVPARVAGVDRISVVTPPLPDGRVDPACLYAARYCGVDTVIRAGGAQAIAALAFGTESVEPVAKIVGPGSRYVAAAKREVAGFVDTGLPAGPTESIVLADGHADPWKVSLDLLVEAEHGADSQALLVTPSRPLAEAVHEVLGELVSEVPQPRRGFLEEVFSGYGGIILCDTLAEGAEVVNEFAPEHLQIHTREPYDTLGLIRNAGEILLGEHSVFSLANYAVGANAVLPTGGTARTWSPVSVRDFMKYSSVVHVTPAGFDTLRDHVIALADYEGFHTHAMALRRRDESL